MLEPGEFEGKFRRLTRSTLGEPDAATLNQRLPRLENEENLEWLGSTGALEIALNAGQALRTPESAGSVQGGNLLRVRPINIGDFLAR
jgi:hypothetical protein